MVVPKATALTTQRAGRDFYFCSQSCLQTFQNPDRELRVMRRRVGFVIGAFARNHLFCHPNFEPMKSTLSALAFTAPLAVLALGLNAVHAQANDMFPTKAAAEKRAKQLKCSGAFAMGSEWMPCKNFDAYEKAVKKDS